MHQSVHIGIHCLCAVLFHYYIIGWIFRCTGKHPDCLIAPVIDWMKSQCCFDCTFEANCHLHCNLQANTGFSILPKELIKKRKPPGTVGVLPVSWWFRSRSQDIINNKMNIAMDFTFYNTGVQILVSMICSVHVQYVHQFKISSIWHYVNDTVECFCLSGYCNDQDWFKSWINGWMPLRWSYLDLYKEARNRI